MDEDKNNRFPDNNDIQDSVLYTRLLYVKMDSKMIFSFSVIIFLMFSSSVIPGTWGVGNFENDAAFGLALDMENSIGSEKSLSVIKDVFLTGYTEADSCSSAIAAAELVATLKDGEYTNLPETLAEWTAKNNQVYEPEVSKIALKAIEAYKFTGRSELVQLWAGANSTEWLNVINKLTHRLQ